MFHCQPLDRFKNFPLISRLFSLLIGIDKYASKEIQPLRGAIADARAVEAYLLNRLHVPQDQITILENESASRGAIIQSLQGLANDPRIQHEDPILIYYAGHGSEVLAPPEWELGDTNGHIQVILPSDVFSKSGGTVVAPIPDRTFSALLEAIAQKKGNNIFVVLDCCYSASGTRSLSDSSNIVRSVQGPAGFQLPADLDQDILSIFPTYGNSNSHILLAASSSSGEAKESSGRGVFTVAFLEILEENQIEELCYFDIVARMDIGCIQSPRCEGFNRDRYIFTTTSPAPFKRFIPAYTRTMKKGRIAHVLNGGAAHGLVVGDEFAIYSDRESAESEGTLVVAELGSFYSVMRSPGSGMPISGNAIAVRVKEMKPPLLRVHIRPCDTACAILSLLLDSNQGIDIVNAPEDAQIDISMQGNEAVCRLRNMGSIFRVEPTAEALTRILKTSSHFFSELARTADFPAITECIQVEVYELGRSSSRFPGAFFPELRPIQGHNEPFSLQEGRPYGLKLINNSDYDLYPHVQYLGPSSELKYDPWYRSECSRPRLDMPLKKNGGFLTIGYGSGGTPPLVISSSGLGFLKISLFSRPLDPFYDDKVFRLAPYLPENFKGPWATIIKPIRHYPFTPVQPSPSDTQHPSEELSIERLASTNIIPTPSGFPVHFKATYNANAYHLEPHEHDNLLLYIQLLTPPKGTLVRELSIPGTVVWAIPEGITKDNNINAHSSSFSSPSFFALIIAMNQWNFSL